MHISKPYRPALTNQLHFCRYLSPQASLRYANFTIRLCNATAAVAAELALPPSLMACDNSTSKAKPLQRNRLVVEKPAPLSGVDQRAWLQMDGDWMDMRTAGDLAAADGSLWRLVVWCLASTNHIQRAVVIASQESQVKYQRPLES